MDPRKPGVITVQYGIDRKTMEPVVVLQENGRTFGALTVAQARNIANDIVQACARA